MFAVLQDFKKAKLVPLLPEVQLSKPQLSESQLAEPSLSKSSIICILDLCIRLYIYQYQCSSQGPIYVSPGLFLLMSPQGCSYLCLPRVVPIYATCNASMVCMSSAVPENINRYY